MFQSVNFGAKPITPDNFKTSLKGTFPGFDIIPLATYSTSGVVLTSVGSKGTDLKTGDFVYSDVNDQVRQVVSGSNNIWELDRAFDVDVAGEALKVISFYNRKVVCRGISVYPSGAGTAVLNGMDYLPTDPPINWFDENGVYPIAYDATASELLFVISY